MSPLGRIILSMRQPVFAFTTQCCVLRRKWPFTCGLSVFFTIMSRLLQRKYNKIIYI